MNSPNEPLTPGAGTWKVGSLLKAEGHCLGGCDDICSSLWPLCGAKYINAVNSDTHTTLIHMMKLFPAHRYTLVESAYFFFLLGTMYVFSFWMRGSCGLKCEALPVGGDHGNDRPSMQFCVVVCIEH